MKQFFRDFVIISISAITLMFFALYDGFPIVTGDTGSYITSGFTLKVPSDRPVFYGLFIRQTSLVPQVGASAPYSRQGSAFVNTSAQPTIV